MKPGEVRTFKKGQGKAVVVAVGVWVERKKESSPLQIHLAGISGRHTTVTNRKGAPRYHRTLFRDLRKLLVDNDCWLYGTEGQETERIV